MTDAKPIKAPLLQKEPEPSSALTLDQRPHCLCHPGVDGSRAAPHPGPGHAQQVTRPLCPLPGCKTRSSTGEGSHRDSARVPRGTCGDPSQREGGWRCAPCQHGAPSSRGSPGGTLSLNHQGRGFRHVNTLEEVKSSRGHSEQSQTPAPPLVPLTQALCTEQKLLAPGKGRNGWVF